VNFLQKMPEDVWGPSWGPSGDQRMSGDHPIYESVRDVNRHVIERLHVTQVNFQHGSSISGKISTSQPQMHPKPPNPSPLLNYPVSVSTSSQTLPCGGKNLGSRLRPVSRHLIRSIIMELYNLSVM
jgi:hypothetical protein